MNKIFTLLLILLPSLCFGQNNLKYVEVVKPKPHTLSPNIVFVVDASSSINSSAEISSKFDKAWKETIARLGSDELYFCIYTFHDEGDERFRDWVDAGGPQGIEEFAKAKRWIKRNTGTYSYGKRAIGMALRQVNKLSFNRVMQRTLTMILITDGGFTEAAQNAFDESPEEAFDIIEDEIVKAQAWRITQGLFKATIRTIGIDNKEVWSLNVKRPNSECQSFLRRIGRVYLGGNYLVKKIRKKKRVS